MTYFNDFFLLIQSGLPDRALDIGCAVGRSSFELTKGLKEVIGIDYSNSFIDAANILKQSGHMNYKIVQEGDIFTNAVAEIEKDIVSATLSRYLK